MTSKTESTPGGITSKEGAARDDVEKKGDREGKGSGNPRLPALGACALLVACGDASWQLPWRDGARAGPVLLRLGLPPALEFEQVPRTAVFVKLHSQRRSVWIFDHWGWRSSAPSNALTLPGDSASLA